MKKKYTSFWIQILGDQKCTKMTLTEQNLLKNQWKSCQIVWKSTKRCHTADHLSLRVFGVRKKQNILGLSTRWDLFESAIIYWFQKLFKKKFFELLFDDFRNFQNGQLQIHVHLPNIEVRLSPPSLLVVT